MSDHRIMNTIDSRRYRPRTHVADTVDVSRPRASLSLHVDSMLQVARRMRSTAGGWLRDLGSSTQLGPDAERVLGRATGART